MSRRRDHDFARQWEQRAFHRHHQHDGRIAAGLQRVRIPIAQTVDDLMHEPVVIPETKAGAIREFYEFVKNPLTQSG